MTFYGYCEKSCHPKPHQWITLEGVLGRGDDPQVGYTYFGSYRTSNINNPGVPPLNNLDKTPINGRYDWLELSFLPEKYAYKNYGILQNGSLWGWSTYGSVNNEDIPNTFLGDGEDNICSNPTRINISGCSNTVWKKVSTCRTHTLAIKDDGSLWAWGSNTHGQLGIDNAYRNGMGGYANAYSPAATGYLNTSIARIRKTINEFGTRYVINSDSFTNGDIPEPNTYIITNGGAGCILNIPYNYRIINLGLSNQGIGYSSKPSIQVQTTGIVRYDATIDPIMLFTVTGVQIVNGGTDYRDTTGIIFSPGIDGDTAEASCSITNGSISNITIIKGGRYTDIPSISIKGQGKNGILNAQVSGYVLGINIINGGLYSLPNLQPIFIGGNPISPATINTVTCSGHVGNIQVINGGSGYKDVGSVYGKIGNYYPLIGETVLTPGPIATLGSGVITYDFTKTSGILQPFKSRITGFSSIYANVGTILNRTSSSPIAKLIFQDGKSPYDLNVFYSGTSSNGDWWCELTQPISGILHNVTKFISEPDWYFMNDWGSPARHNKIRYAYYRDYPNLIERTEFLGCVNKIDSIASGSIYEFVSPKYTGDYTSVSGNIIPPYPILPWGRFFPGADFDRFFIGSSSTGVIPAKSYIEQINVPRENFYPDFDLVYDHDGILNMTKASISYTLSDYNQYSIRINPEIVTSGNGYTKALKIQFWPKGVLYPVRIGSDNDWKDVCAISNISMATKEDDTVWHWGDIRSNNPFLVRHYIWSPKRKGWSPILRLVEPNQTIFKSVVNDKLQSNPQVVNNLLNYDTVGEFVPDILVLNDRYDYDTISISPGPDFIYGPGANRFFTSRDCSGQSLFALPARVDEIFAFYAPSPGAISGSHQNIFKQPIKGYSDYRRVIVKGDCYLNTPSNNNMSADFSFVGLNEPYGGIKKLFSNNFADGVFDRDIIYGVDHNNHIWRLTRNRNVVRAKGVQDSISTIPCYAYSGSWNLSWNFPVGTGTMYWQVGSSDDFYNCPIYSGQASYDRLTYPTTNHQVSSSWIAVSSIYPYTSYELIMTNPGQNYKATDTTLIIISGAKAFTWERQLFSSCAQTGNYVGLQIPRVKYVYDSYVYGPNYTGIIQGRTQGDLNTLAPSYAITGIPAYYSTCPTSPSVEYTTQNFYSSVSWSGYDYYIQKNYNINPTIISLANLRDRLSIVDGQYMIDSRLETGGSIFAYYLYGDIRGEGVTGSRVFYTKLPSVTTTTTGSGTGLSFAIRPIKQQSLEERYNNNPTTLGAENITYRLVSLGYNIINDAENNFSNTHINTTSGLHHIICPDITLPPSFQQENLSLYNNVGLTANNELYFLHPKSPPAIPKAPLNFELFITNKGYIYHTPPLIEIDQPYNTIAKAKATINGSIVSIGIDKAGEGYTSNPIISFSGGEGANASASGVIEGPIIDVSITNPGSNYTIPPKVIFNGKGIPARGYCTIANGQINKVYVIDGGKYRSPPTVTFESQNQVISLNLTSGGTGYTSAPKVVIVGGGGGGATAKATINNGSVDSITLTNPGQGFDIAPKVVFLGGDGIGAQATASIGSLGSGGSGNGILNGKLIYIKVINSGNNYQYSPRVIISGGGNIEADILTSKLNNNEITYDTYIQSKHTSVAQCRIEGSIANIDITNPGNYYTISGINNPYANESKETIDYSPYHSGIYNLDNTFLISSPNADLTRIRSVGQVYGLNQPSGSIDILGKIEIGFNSAINYPGSPISLPVSGLSNYTSNKFFQQPLIKFPNSVGLLVNKVTEAKNTSRGLRVNAYNLILPRSNKFQEIKLFNITDKRLGLFSFTPYYDPFIFPRSPYRYRFDKIENPFTTLDGKVFRLTDIRFANPPTFILADTLGEGAVLSSTLNNDYLDTVTFSNQGSNYTQDAVLQMTEANINFVQCTAVAHVTNGSIDYITITDPGDGYIDPKVIIHDGRGNGARATAYQLSNQSVPRGISSIVVNRGGSNYSSDNLPQVYIYDAAKFKDSDYWVAINNGLKEYYSLNEAFNWNSGTCEYVRPLQNSEINPIDTEYCWDITPNVVRGARTTEFNGYVTIIGPGIISSGYVSRLKPVMYSGQKIYDQYAQFKEIESLIPQHDLNFSKTVYKDFPNIEFINSIPYINPSVTGNLVGWELPIAATRFNLTATKYSG